MTPYQRKRKLVLAAPDLQPVAFKYLARALNLAKFLPLLHEKRDLELKLLGAITRSVGNTSPHFTFLFSRWDRASSCNDF
jgi:hypothetical protein